MTKGFTYVFALTLVGLLYVCHSNVVFCQAESEPALTRQDREALHHIARRTVECIVRGEEFPSFPITSERLREHRGAFVTLKKEGQLRGCIGCLRGAMPLCETVKRMAIQAATNDARFPPVVPEELPVLQFEISVLSPLRPVRAVDEIVVGKHGLLIVHGNRSGVLLPQVASENGWDRRTFLEHLSRKAGLAKDAWRSQASQIYSFTAEVF